MQLSAAYCCDTIALMMVLLETDHDLGSRYQCPPCRTLRKAPSAWLSRPQLLMSAYAKAHRIFSDKIIVVVGNCRLESMAVQAFVNSLVGSLL